LSNTDKILNDIRAYLRISAAAASKATAIKVIDTQEKAQVCEKLSGEASQQKIETETDVPQQTVSRWCDEFVEAGLASRPNEYCENYKALFSLRELGIKMSELKKRKKVQEEKTKKEETKNEQPNQRDDRDSP